MIYLTDMGLKNLLISCALLFPTSWNPDTYNNSLNENSDKIENIQQPTKKWIYVCLETDSKTSFTHTKVLESITDPKNTVVEYPISQLFKLYEGKPHPLAVPGVKIDLTALLWVWWIERLKNFRIPQNTSRNEYQKWDTVRISLIDQSLEWVFPELLSKQLKEKWFQTYLDRDSAEITRRMKNKNKSDFIYDVVLKPSSWKYVLGVYRDGILFMVCYTSIWLNKIERNKNKNRYEDLRTIQWQFKIWEKINDKMKGEDPYYRSSTYNQAPMPFALRFYWWYFLHQREIDWFERSHWCIGLCWVISDILYSLLYQSIKKGKYPDLFIHDNLYRKPVKDPRINKNFNNKPKNNPPRNNKKIPVKNPRR